LEFGIWNLESGIWNLESGIWNLEFFAAVKKRIYCSKINFRRFNSLFYLIRLNSAAISTFAYLFYPIILSTLNHGSHGLRLEAKS
jgi:hypothetical protein